MPWGDPSVSSHSAGFEFCTRNGADPRAGSWGSLAVGIYNTWSAADWLSPRGKVGR